MKKLDEMLKVGFHKFCDKDAFKAEQDNDLLKAITCHRVVEDKLNV